MSVAQGRRTDNSLVPNVPAVHQHAASVKHTNKCIHTLLGVESELAIGIPREREQE